MTPYYIKRYQLQIGTRHRHLPSISTRIRLCTAVAADFQQPLKGVQGGEQKTGTVLREKLAGKVFRQLDTFGSQFYEPISFISSDLEKH